MTECVTIPGTRTASYVCLTDSTGNLQGGVADMDINTHFQANSIRFSNALYVVLDANFSLEAMETISKQAVSEGCKVILDPTSFAKSEKCVSILEHVWMVTPDRKEVIRLADEHGDELSDIQRAAGKLITRYPSLEYVLCKVDMDGVILVSRSDYHHYPAVQVESIQSCSGAGDCMVGAIVSSLVQGKSMEEAVQVGLQAAALSLQSNETVPKSLQSL